MTDSEKIKEIKDLIETSKVVTIEDVAQTMIKVIDIVYK